VDLFFKILAPTLFVFGIEMTSKKRNNHILVVDDDPNMIKLIQFYLLKENYEITSCTKGQEALSLLEKDKFDVILIDILMPEMDGHTLLKKMIEELKIDTPILVVTAHGTSDNLMQMIDDGAYDILQKPFTTNRLKLTLRNALLHKKMTEKCKGLEAKLTQD
jgi:DNA-binding NtrC family response regulator